jgi:predicted acylesterase/phospholipase RssA
LSPENLKICLSLVSDFHTRVKLEWKTISDYVIKGQEWIQDISLSYSDNEVSQYLKDTLYSEMHYFATNSGAAIKSNTPFDVLIMKGGGIKGLAYVGALEEISKHYEFTWYAGTSAGAITAVLLGADYSTEELRTILEQKNFKDFKDAWIAKACWNLFSKHGFYEANNFLLWLNKLLAKKLDSSTEVRLVDLPKRTTVYASKRNKNAVVFDSFLPQSQNISAAFAARCSMSIPIIFTPQKSEGLNIFDGGLQNNFPVEQLLKDNPDANFVAFYLGSEIFEWKKNNLFKDIITIWTESSDPDTLSKYKDQIVIIDPSPISTLQFKLNSKEKEFLLEAGRLAAIKFLEYKKLINKDEEPYNFNTRKTQLDKDRLILKRKKKIQLFKKIAIVVAFTISIFYLKTLFVISTNLYNFIIQMF